MLFCGPSSIRYFHVAIFGKFSAHTVFLTSAIVLNSMLFLVLLAEVVVHFALPVRYVILTLPLPEIFQLTQFY